MADNEFKTVPFSVIGGFLGAGKTSLVNHILATASQRYAVLVNDFGALNVDASLIREHQGDTLALANGCVCCSLAAGFSKSLGQILDRLEQFDHVVVEASGVADPGRIQDIARIEPRLAVRGNPVLLDGQQLLQQAQDAHISSLIHRQIAAADLMLINKQGLLSTAEKRSLGYYLQQLSDAPQQFIDWGRVDAEQLLGLKPTAAKIAAFAVINADHGLYNQVVRSEKSLTSGQFAEWEQALSADVLRGKGLVSFTDKPGVWLWQRVGEQQSLMVYESQNFLAENACELLLIGKRKASLPVDFTLN